MNNFVKKLYDDLEENLSEFSDIGTTPVMRLTSSLKCVSTALDNLKTYVTEHRFLNNKDEIDFFKYQKPRFYSWSIYLVEVYGIENCLPPGSSQMQRQYYLNELNLIERTHNQFRTIYQYYLDNETYKDEEYFLLSAFVPYLPGQEYCQSIAGFSTNQDYLFSKFRAVDKLQDYIISKITQLENGVAEDLAKAVLIRNSRRWTGEKINLIEIAYGIYFTGQMNDGKADIKEIISWLASSLNVDLGQAYRMFLDIKRRKAISYTRFLDRMGNEISKHIQETYNYKPQKK